MGVDCLDNWTPEQVLEFYSDSDIEAWMTSPDYLVVQPLYYLDHEYSSDEDIG